MRILFTTIASMVLISGVAIAAHGHDHQDKKEPDTTKAETSYGSHSSYGSGSDHQMMDHGKMDHGSMNHGSMDHSKMDHGDGHMKGPNTMPADGAILAHSPKMVGVDFGHAMNVESVTLSTLAGDLIVLDVFEIGKTSHFMVKTPELQADDYTVDWRARGDDGHVMSGSFAFTIE